VSLDRVKSGAVSPGLSLALTSAPRADCVCRVAEGPA